MSMNMNMNTICRRKRSSHRMSSTSTRTSTTTRLGVSVSVSVSLALTLALLVATCLPSFTVATDSNFTNNYNAQTNSGGFSSYSSSSNVYGVNFFAESSTTEYNGYQQAWRYLGWYVDCGHPSDRYNEGNSHNSHNSHENDRAYGNMYCQRFLMWAAYIDPNYSGGGIGEYSFYDYNSQSWDETACNYHGNGRCAPMDCHELDTTTWELLGVFKEAAYFGNDAFFEQLFKHEGVCVWNDEDMYDFMSSTREDSWSEGCLQTYTLNDDQSDYLYIDLKPTFNGNMTYALYTDYVCSEEYDGTKIAVDTVAAKMGLLYGDYLNMWNDGLEIYKVCQPCRTYNLQYTSASSSYSSSKGRYSKYSNGKYQYYSNSVSGGGGGGSGSSAYNKYNSGNYNKNNNGRDRDRDLASAYNYYSSSNGYNANGNNNNNNNNKNQNNNNNNNDKDNQQYGNPDDDNYQDPNEGYFQCDDDADYSNVNQCMKFRTHAELQSATWEDLVAATNQGGILQINVSGTIFGSERISREQQGYLDQTFRKEAQQYKAEKQAAQEALNVSQQKKAGAFRFMVTGALALACAILYTGKKLLSGAAATSESTMDAPLYASEGGTIA